MLSFLYVFLLLSEVGISVFRNAEVPKVGISDYRSSEMPKVGVSDYRNVEVPIFGISDLQSRQQRNSFFCLYIKASEFQCSSVYCWSSLEEYLILYSQ